MLMSMWEPPSLTCDGLLLEQVHFDSRHPIHLHHLGQHDCRPSGADLGRVGRVVQQLTQGGALRYSRSRGMCVCV